MCSAAAEVLVNYCTENRRSGYSATYEKVTYCAWFGTRKKGEIEGSSIFGSQGRRSVSRFVQVSFCWLGAELAKKIRYSTFHNRLHQP